MDNKTVKPAQINMFRDAPWPGGVLSNFAETPFTVDGVLCRCSEGFIQSLKFSDPFKQVEMCSLGGREAWGIGSSETESVFRVGAVYWLDSTYRLHSQQHFDLLRRALLKKFTQSQVAKEALLASGRAELVHDFGKPQGAQASLPVAVFCQMVSEIREQLSGCS